MKQPKISLIVIYNNANNLKECIDSLIQQSFSDIEIICVSNSADENAQNIVQNISDERIKLINLPLLNDDNTAKKAALGISSGDFICFINPKDIPPCDFVKNLYISLISKKEFDFKDNHLYRRTFLENDEEITQIIKNSIKSELKQHEAVINNQKNTIKDEFNKFYQINTENIKNSSYDVICRFNQLEKLFYDKDSQNNQKIQDFINELNEKTDNKINQIYADISKVYEYINAEINKKGREINTVYEEITKNYHYTEQLIEDKTTGLYQNTNNGHDEIWNKLNELEKEIANRYFNIKNLLDVRIKEITSCENTINSGNETNQLSELYLDTIYSRIDKASSLFYEELSKIYKNLNEKLTKKSEEDKYIFETKISELRNEFNTKIQALKDELS